MYINDNDHKIAYNNSDDDNSNDTGGDSQQIYNLNTVHKGKHSNNDDDGDGGDSGC